MKSLKRPPKTGAGKREPRRAPKVEKFNLRDLTRIFKRASQRGSDAYCRAIVEMVASDESFFATWKSLTRDILLDRAETQEGLKDLLAITNDSFDDDF